MVTYKEAVDFVKLNTGVIRAVIHSDGKCAACDAVEAVILSAGIPYVILDISDPELVFKTNYCPMTYFFMADDSCWLRQDVFDADMMTWYFDQIKELQKNG